METTSPLSHLTVNTLYSRRPKDPRPARSGRLRVISQTSFRPIFPSPTSSSRMPEPHGCPRPVWRVSCWPQPWRGLQPAAGEFDGSRNSFFNRNHTWKLAYRPHHANSTALARTTRSCLTELAKMVDFNGAGTASRSPFWVRREAAGTAQADVIRSKAALTQSSHSPATVLVLDFRLGA
jgi:hypothetical protein